MWSPVVMIQRDLDVDVVTAARQRIINAFSNGVKVYFSISGGKDSITLSHMILSLIREGRIDPALLTVDFIDEEAMFDDVIESVALWRKRFLAVGVEFRWYCVEVKHFNCFNALENDESFYCWDSLQPDRWVRPMPSFAITDHPRLNRRTDRFQMFLPKVHADGISMGGMRNAESVHRHNAFRPDYRGTGMFSPMYDWRDVDVWRYIEEHDLEFPETYLRMYQVGRSRREMRISQFFSIDTAKTLVPLGEFDPDLMDRVNRREPNAYLAALYWNSEMFRGGTRRTAKAIEESGSGMADEIRDPKRAVLEHLSDPSRSPTTEKRRLARLVRNTIITWGLYLEDPEWRSLHDVLVSGDPKNRTVRAVITNAAKRGSLDV